MRSDKIPPALRLATLGLAMFGAAFFGATSKGHADLVLSFTATVVPSYDDRGIIHSTTDDTNDVFGGLTASELAGKVITGSVSITTSGLSNECQFNGYPSCFYDVVGNSITSNWTLNGYKVSYTSIAYGGIVFVGNPATSGSNSVLTISDGDTGAEQLFATFDDSLSFDAYGNGDSTSDPSNAANAIGSLGGINIGALTGGYLLFQSYNDEQIVASLDTIAVAEPSAFAIFLSAFAAVTAIAARKTRLQR